MTQTQTQLDELRHRVEAKRKRLEAWLEETRADASAQAQSARESVRGKLDELNDHLREGWDNVTEATVGKLNDWLDTEPKQKENH